MLEALYWEPPRSLSPGVLLAVPTGEMSGSWISLASRLRKHGYGVLALELSDSAEASEELMSAFEYMRLRKKVDAARIGIVGFGSTAGSALEVAAGDPLVRTVALMAPEVSFSEPKVETLAHSYGFRPILLLKGDANEGRDDDPWKALTGRATVEQPTESDEIADSVIAFLAQHL